MGPRRRLDDSSEDFTIWWRATRGRVLRGREGRARLEEWRVPLCPDRHVLSRIGRQVPLARMRAYVPGSEYFANASAMVFFTAVFARIAWRYPFARAYRAALIESGHVCQTFLLAAARLGLAPFSVMALADSLIERDLGIDGISESVLYAAGVGRPPRGAQWAPLPKGPNPKLQKTAESRFRGSGFRVQGSRFRVQGSARIAWALAITY